MKFIHCTNLYSNLSYSTCQIQWIVFELHVPEPVLGNSNSIVRACTKIKPELHTCNKQQHLKCVRPFVSESCTVQISQALIQPHSVQTCGMLPGTVIKLVLKLYNFQMTSSDKDFRFMATNDLMAELQKDSIKLDDDSERKVSLLCSIDKTSS